MKLIEMLNPAGRAIKIPDVFVHNKLKEGFRLLNSISGNKDLDVVLIDLQNLGVDISQIRHK